MDPTDPNLVYRGWRFGLRGTAIENAAPRQPLVSVSSNGGKTWSEAVNAFAALEGGEKLYAGDVPVMVVGPDHTVYAFTKEIQDAAIPAAQRGKVRLFLSKSTDSGKTWVTSVANPGATSVTNPFAAIDPRNGKPLRDLGPARGHRAPAGAVHGFLGQGQDVVGAPQPARRPRRLRHRALQPRHQRRPQRAGRRRVVRLPQRPRLRGPHGHGRSRIRYADVYMASSTDGGKTWSPNIRVTDRSIDTTIGVTFSNSSSMPTTAPPGGGRSVLLGRSTDGGLTWNTSIVHAAPRATEEATELNWQAHVAIDPANEQRVVATWRRAFQVPTGTPSRPVRPFMAISTDGGASFGPPVMLMDKATGFEGPRLTLADGKFFAFYRENGPAAGPTVPEPRLTTVAAGRNRRDGGLPAAPEPLRTGAHLTPTAVSCCCPGPGGWWSWSGTGSSGRRTRLWWWAARW